MNLTDIEANISDIQIIWNELCRNDELPSKADAIVVGGTTDLGVAERAAQLYQNGISKKIIVSGYAQPDMSLTEAELLSKRCIEFGVAEDDLILERKASNTGENILFSSSLIGNAVSIILVHKPYMSRRFLATARAQWPSPQPIFYVTHENISHLDYLKRVDAVGTVRTMLGDFKRMELYAKQGFQIPQVISHESTQAFHRLVAQGFEVR